MPDEVLTTSDVAKLPPAVASLLDPAIALPADVAFFEKRFDMADITRTLLLGAGLGVVSLIVIPIGAAMVYWDWKQTQPTVYSHYTLAPLGIGLLLALCAVVTLVSVPTRLRFRRRQLRGECTRRGTFLTPDALIDASDTDATTIVIPAAAFRGIDGGDVKYERGGAVKAYTLPKAVIDSTVADRDQAIRAWAGFELAPQLSARRV